jgi:type II secretory pathway component PulC
MFPHRDSSGTVDGFRLSGVRTRSLPAQIGLRNGDIIQSLNDQPYTSMDEAMNTYVQFQADPTRPRVLILGIRRINAQMAITIDIVEPESVDSP